MDEPERPTHTMEYYSVTKRTEVLTQAATWENLEKYHVE